MAAGINLKNVGDRMSGFKDVVGHKNIIQYIGNAVTSDTVSHAYNSFSESLARYLSNF